MEKRETFYEARVMGKENIYGVAAKRGGIFMLVLQYPSFPEINAGQFIMLEPLSAGSCMPRPFTPFTVEDGKITLVIKNVGRNTDLYSRLSPGDKIKIAGPFGNPFSTVQDHNYILVGGGMGIAALGMIAKYLHSELGERGLVITILLGAKNAGEIFGFNYFRRFGKVKVVSENENNGKLVIDLLKEELAQAGGYPSIIACGPRAMLKEVTSIASRHSCCCEVIMEEVMACGTGMCYGCAVFGIDGKAYKVCEDGPVFPAFLIDWKKACPEYIKVIPRPKRKFAIPDTKLPLGLTLVGRAAPRIYLSSPILNASGCLELGAMQRGQINITRLGAIFPKGIELKPSQGNPSPRVCEAEGGMLNSIGLQNVGLERFVDEVLPEWFEFGKPLFPNISGKTLDEYAALAARLRHTSVAGVEVNLGCPNIEKGGMLFGQNPEAAYQAVKLVRQKCKGKFLIAKLTPNVADIVAIAQAVKKAGADAVSIGNTAQAMAIDPWTKKSKIAKGLAGMSGSAILPRTVSLVFQVAKANIGIPIIAGGGVSNAEDAMQLILAGANAIFCGTASFANPNIFTELYNGLLQFVEYYKVKNLQELVGKVELVK